MKQTNIFIKTNLNLKDNNQIKSIREPRVQDKVTSNWSE